MKIEKGRERTRNVIHCVCIHFINIFPNQLHLIYFPTFNIHISLWIFRTSLGFCFINHIFFCPNVFMFCLFVCLSPLHWHIQRRKPEHKIENEDERRESSISFPDTFVTLQTIESEPGPSPFHNNCRSNSESFRHFQRQFVNHAHRSNVCAFRISNNNKYSKQNMNNNKKMDFFSLLHQFDLSVKCDVNRWLAYWHSRNLFCPKGKRWTLNHLHNNWNVHYLPVQSFFFHSLFASFVFVL